MGFGSLGLRGLRVHGSLPNWEPPFIPLTTVILVMGTPREVPLILGTARIFVPKNVKAKRCASVSIEGLKVGGWLGGDGHMDPRFRV